MPELCGVLRLGAHPWQLQDFWPRPPYSQSGVEAPCFGASSSLLRWLSVHEMLVLLANVYSWFSVHELLLLLVFCE